MSPSRSDLSTEQRIAARSRLGSIPEHRPELGHCIEWDGSHNGPDGYSEMSLEGRKVYVHRIVFKLRNSRVNIDAMKIDHRCHNHGCIRGSHLRALTQAENMENRRGATRASTTGVRNVYPHRGRYVVRVTKGGKSYAGGGYSTLAGAERAAVSLRAELGMTS